MGDPDRGPPAPGQPPDWARAGAAAQRLLAARRDSLALWGAYAVLQTQARQLKVRRIGSWRGLRGLLWTDQS